jgi:hypothetical protein
MSADHHYASGRVKSSDSLSQADFSIVIDRAHLAKYRRSELKAYQSYKRDNKEKYK